MNHETTSVATAAIFDGSNRVRFLPDDITRRCLAVATPGMTDVEREVRSEATLSQLSRPQESLANVPRVTISTARRQLATFVVRRAAHEYATSREDTRNVDARVASLAGGIERFALEHRDAASIDLAALARVSWQALDVVGEGFEDEKWRLPITLMTDLAELDALAIALRESCLSLFTKLKDCDALQSTPGGPLASVVTLAGQPTPTVTLWFAKLAEVGAPPDELWMRSVAKVKGADFDSVCANLGQSWAQFRDGLLDCPTQQKQWYLSMVSTEDARDRTADLAPRLDGTWESFLPPLTELRGRYLDTKSHLLRAQIRQVALLASNVARARLLAKAFATWSTIASNHVERSLLAVADSTEGWVLTIDRFSQMMPVDNRSLHGAERDAGSAK